MVLVYLRVDFWQWIDQINPPTSFTAFSDPICWNREKDKTKTKKMMGRNENWPKKIGGDFLAVNTFLPKLKWLLLDLSVLYA